MIQNEIRFSTYIDQFSLVILLLDLSTSSSISKRTVRCVPPFFYASLVASNSMLILSDVF